MVPSTLPERSRVDAAAEQRRAPASTTPNTSSPQHGAAVQRLAGSAGLLVWIAGMVSIVSGLLPPDRGRLRTVADALGLPAAAAAAAACVALGVVLVLLARGLRRRQRRAWRLAVALLCAGAVLHVVKGLDVEEAGLCLLVAAALIVSRSQFRALPDPERRHHPFVLFVGLLTGSVLAGLLALQVNVSTVDEWSWRARFSTVLHGFVGLPGPIRFTTDRASDLVTALLLGLGLLTIVLPLVVALRTTRHVDALSPSDVERLRQLLDTRPDGDSLGYFALRHDKHVVFSPSGKSAVSYRVVSGVALASGDPVGDPEAWPGAITAFLDMADRSGWVPAVLGCSERGGTAWGRAGLAAWEIGDEAVVDVPSFSLQGRAMRGVRQAVSRAERAGYTTRVRRVADIGADELDELRHAADRWRDGPTERGFSMALGRLGQPGDEQCVVAEARQSGELQALLHFVPWGVDGLSLDLMRRSRDSANGVMELLVAAALDAAAGMGVLRVSLNFAPFRSALEGGARLGAGPVLRAWRAVLLLASRFWQIDSLYRFNAKFRPRWEPRFICYRRANDLARVSIAAMQAEAFLPVPTLVPKRLSRRHGAAAGAETATT